jgi:hypothetical protein
LVSKQNIFGGSTGSWSFYGRQFMDESIDREFYCIEENGGEK